MVLPSRYSHLPSFISLLTVSLTALSLLTPSTASPAGPSTLQTAIREYLQQGGHAKLQRAFNLSKHVYYDPTMFFTREHAYERRDGKVVPRRIDGTRPSDLDLIRAMGLHVPGVDSEASLLISRQTSQCSNGNTPPKRITGSKSRIDVAYSPKTPEQVKAPVEFAVARWTAEFKSGVVIRICFGWGGLNGVTLGEQTLGTTNTPYFTYGRDHSKLRDDAVYNPALASALQDKDIIPEGKFHVHMVLNSEIPWHLDTNSEAPAKKYDLATTVLHELTHGLFFSGTIEVPQDKRTASFMRDVPGRFDTFMKVEDDIGVVRACTKGSKLFNAVTSPNLRFFDQAVGANFGLYAPWPFARGSSIYHFNNTQSLTRDCQALGIAKEQCSDLMTHELVYQYTQRSLGETTLRVYRAVLSSAAGSGRGRNCDIPENSGRAGLTAGEVEPFTLPHWAIILVAALGGVGAILVFVVVVSSIARGKK